MADYVGEQFGDYRLIRRLGGGSYGDVYFAEHIRDKAQVAVKVLKTNEEDIEDYINEIRALFRLQHKNIVPLRDFGIKQKILDSGIKQRIPFLVMAYTSNGTLRRPRGTKFPLVSVVGLVKQIAEALQFAHDNHIIHCDVKPENMLIAPQFQVWLSDFGIAGIAHSTKSLPKNQEKLGTLAYMSPEQFEGEPVRASDQYSLGIMAYEWICGNRPLNHRKDDLQPLRELVPHLPAAVEEVVMTALAKDPKRRFASVRAFATALEQAAKAPTISPSVESKRNDLVETQGKTIDSVPEVKKASTLVPPAPPAPASSIVEPSNEKKTLSLDEPEPSISPGRVDKMNAKLEAIDERVVRRADGSDLLGAPMESFDKPLLFPPHPLVAQEIPLSLRHPIVGVPSNNDDRQVKPLQTPPLEQIVEAEDNALTPDQHAIQQENYRRLYAAIVQLTPAQQQLIHLRYDNGLRLVAIAELLAQPESSVREMLALTLSQLRAIYENTERGTK